MTRYAKSITALLTALGTWGVTAFADDTVSSVELFGLLGVAIATISVFAVPNSPPPGEARNPAMSEQAPEAGQVESTTLITICIVILAVVAVLFALGVVPN